MKQLVQLQKLKAEFKALNSEVLVVLREDEDGVAGLKKAVQKTNFTPILLDTPIKETAAYSQKDFVTYLIDKKGIIVAELGGTKLKRPTGEIVLKKARELFKK